MKLKRIIYTQEPGAVKYTDIENLAFRNKLFSISNVCENFEIQKIQWIFIK